MVGIILNSAASASQGNLATANKSVQDSIGRLSSGNRIINAKDDVAGLAIGTILQTNVSTMKAALTNTAQAASLLGVADGALDNIGQILQRQKALASQATSGSLDDTARAFLDQEFQGLVQQIDQIAATTNFNGISLIDGSLFTSSDIVTKTSTASTSLSARIGFTTAVAAGEYIQLFSAATTAPAGISRDTTDTFQNIQFTSKATGTDASSPLNMLQFDGTGSAASAATNFMSMIENLKKYTGDNATVLTARNIASSFDFSLSGTTMTMTAKSAGSNWNLMDIRTPATAGTLSVNGAANTASQVVVLATGGTAAVDGSLPAGGFSSAGVATAGATAYSNDVNAPKLVPSTYAQGSVSDSLLSSLTPTKSWTTGVNLSGVSNNPAFVGSLPAFSAQYSDANNVNLSVKVGDITYTANSVNTLPAGAANDLVTFYSDSGSNGGSFTLQFSTGKGLSVASQTDADTYVARLNSAFTEVDIFQRRQISNYTAAGTIYPTGSSTASGDLSNSKFYMISDSFENIQIEDVTIQAPPSGTSSAVISIKVNGEVYTSGYNYDGSTLPLSGLATPNVLANNYGANTDGKYGFVNQSNPNKMLIMQYGSATSLDLSSADKAAGAEEALKKAFGIGSGSNNSGITFQVGTSSSDVIAVEIQGVKTSQIYTDSNNTPLTLSIKTLSGAQAAGTSLDNAIKTVTATRATVGSLDSRFDFASASIQSSIENQDAARSVFLDADISAESTALAQAQVRLQASISTLAQANQLTQSFLKLIG